MPKKSHEKKKMFKKICREKVKSGMINGPDGSWIAYNMSNAMHQHQRAGYKL